MVLAAWWPTVYHRHRSPIKGMLADHLRGQPHQIEILRFAVLQNLRELGAHKPVEFCLGSPLLTDRMQHNMHGRTV